MQLWVLNHVKSTICTSWDFISYYVVLGVQLVYSFFSTMIGYWIDVGKIAHEKIQEKKKALENEQEKEKDEDEDSEGGETDEEGVEQRVEQRLQREAEEVRERRRREN